MFGADTYRAHAQMLSTEGSDVRDAWLTRMRDPSPTVVSSTPQGPLDWPDATVVNGDAVDAVARLEDSGDLLRAAPHGPALEDSSHPPGRPDQRQVPDEVDRRPDHGEVGVDQRAAGLGERVQLRERLVLRGCCRRTSSCPARGPTPKGRNGPEDGIPWATPQVDQVTAPRIAAVRTPPTLHRPSAAAHGPARPGVCRCPGYGGPWGPRAGLRPHGRRSTPMRVCMRACARAAAAVSPRSWIPRLGSTLGDSMFHGYWWRAAHRYGPFDAVLPPSTDRRSASRAAGRPARVPPPLTPNRRPWPPGCPPARRATPAEQRSR